MRTIRTLTALPAATAPARPMRTVRTLTALAATAPARPMRTIRTLTALAATPPARPMRTIRTLIALAATALSLTAAPAAFAQTNAVGNSNGNATMNICLAQINCTYVNFRHGKPTDVVRRTGTIADWSLNAGSVSGQVQLRILRPTGHGHYKVIRSSAVETVATAGLNTFSTSLKVKRGDVLALSNATSGIYMSSAPSGTSVRYFSGAVSNGSAMTPGTVSPQLHLLLSAHVIS